MTSSNQLKQVVSIKKHFETEEPMHCQKQGCKEELNGLMHYTFDFGAGFVFELWLCQDCSKEFKRLGGEAKFLSQSIS